MTAARLSVPDIDAMLPTHYRRQRIRFTDSMADAAVRWPVVESVTDIPASPLHNLPGNVSVCLIGLTRVNGVPYYVQAQVSLIDERRLERPRVWMAFDEVSASDAAEWRRRWQHMRGILAAALGEA